MKKKFCVGLLLLGCVLAISSPSCRADALADLGAAQTECYRLKLLVEASIFRTNDYRDECVPRMEEARVACEAIEGGDERYADAHNGMEDLQRTWDRGSLHYDTGATAKAAADVDLAKSEDVTNGRTVGDRLADAQTALEHYQTAHDDFILNAETDFSGLRYDISALILLMQ